MKVVTIYSAYICIVVHYFLIMFNVSSTLYEGKTFSRLMFNLWCMKGLKDASAEIQLFDTNLTNIDAVACQQFEDPN